MSKFSSQLRFADKSDVQQAAEQLIRLYGATTTLEVKNMLCEHGFVAFEEDVSCYLEMIASEQDWTYEFNGRYRIYSDNAMERFSVRLGMPAFSLN